MSHDRALLDAVAERTLAIEDGELHAYDGGWAEMLRRREQRSSAAAAATRAEKAEKAERPRRRRSRSRPRSRGRSVPSELERVEAEIAAQEAEVARLEEKLAEDWSDVDVLAAHKRSRDALTALLERWETLFEQASTPG